MSIGREGEAGCRRAELASTGMDMFSPSYPRGRVSKNRLHNFSFLTGSWGRHRIFRCVNPASEKGFSGLGLTAMETQKDNRSQKRQSSSPGKLQASSPIRGGSSGMEVEEGRGEDIPVAALVDAKPWNLRTRRAAGIAPGENGRNRDPGIPPSHRQFQKDYLGRTDQMTLEGSEQPQRRKFAVSLSKKEIEEDFYMFKGTKPPRRPQKRARIVQRQLDDLFPGFWLEEVTLDSYKIEKLR